MRYLMLGITFGAMAFSAAMAADSEKSAQVKPWTDDYQYGEGQGQNKVAATNDEAMPEKSSSLKGGEDRPKTGKPSEGGEFEIAPKPEK